jgi:outer membrane receptor protein involved in Fe transport
MINGMSRRGALLGTTLFAGMAIAGGAWAQAAPASPPAPAAGETLTELVVTGTRIPRPNLEQPTPVTVLSPTIIQQAGPQNLGDIIAQLPSVGTTTTVRANSNNFANTAGISSIDLRNLGTSRTLVLVDGQRHVNGDVSLNAVDVNSIPTALVDHVEVTTGGASAIYGSDAVSGVVNIILKKRFEGFQFDGQVGSYDGFGGKYSADFIAGKTFLDDRLNLTFTGFYNKENTIWVRDVPGAHNYGTIDNPNDLSGPLDPTFYSSPGTIPNDGVPDRVYVPNVGSDYVTPNGTLLDAGAFLPSIMFDKQGHAIPVPARSGYNSFAFGQLPPDCRDCYFGEDLNQEQSPIETKGADFRVNFDWTDHLHANLDAKFVQSDVKNLVQPSFTFADFQLQPDNAFIQPDLRALLPPASDPGDYPLIAEFLQPQGRSQDIRRRTYRIVAGLNGDFDAGFAQINWDGALNYGKVSTVIRNNDLQITANFDAAFDSVIDPLTGQAACRINVPGSGGPALADDEIDAAPGCVPFNPFAPARNSAAALAYSFGAFDTHDTLSQEVADLNANFDTSRFFSLQGGPLSVAVGGEYRMERTKDVNDPALVAGLTEALYADSSGGYNVKEAYIELSQTIFKDYAPFLQELTVDAAYRIADYSTIGRVGAYKFSGDYAPVQWLKFRSTYSRSIRAPNITEAFLPATPGFFDVIDPCSVENITTHVNYAANCARQGLPAGFVANTNETITGVETGNPDLNPEKSISYTGGIVFQPPVVPGLAITLDFYAIKIKNAINEVSAQDIVNNCYDSANLDPTFCSLFTRGPDNNINFVKTTFINSSKLLTQGYELHVTYSHDVSPLTERWRATQGLTGTVAFDLSANYVARLRDFPFQSDPTTYHVLEGRATNIGSATAFEGTPHWKGIADTTYKQGPMTVNWQVRYVGKGALFNIDPTSVDRSEALSVPFAKSVFYHDISLRYRLDDRFGGWGDGVEVFAGVNNAFGEGPPAVTIGTGADVNYDLGRFFYTGVKIRR